MVNLSRYYRLFMEYKDIAEFTVVYVKEAHASDSWFVLNNNVSRKYAECIDDRVEAVKEMIDLWKEKEEGLEDVIGDGPDDDQKQSINFLVDNMDNEVSTKLVALPERLYIVEDQKVVFQGGNGPFDYDIGAVEEFLKERRAQTNL